MKRFLGIVIVLMVIAATGLLIYRSSITDKKPMTEIGKLKSLDMVEDYPTTKEGVVELFCRITKQFYISENEDKEIAALANQMRHLFDKQLLSNNPYSDYMDRLNKEISSYKNLNRVIIAYTIDQITKEDSAVVNEEELCTVRVYFDLVDKEEADIKVYEKILLVKENGKWKIRGWTEADVFLE